MDENWIVEVEKSWNDVYYCKQIFVFAIEIYINLINTAGRCGGDARNALISQREPSVNHTDTSRLISTPNKSTTLIRSVSEALFYKNDALPSSALRGTLYWKIYHFHGMRLTFAIDWKYTYVPT